MKLDRKAKAFLALFLLALLGIYYQSAAASHSIYFPKSELENNYSRFIGKRIGLSGMVTSVAESSFVIVAEYSDGLQIKKKSFAIMQGADAAVGDVVNVDGVLGEEYKVLPMKMIIYKKQDYRFLFIRSIFGPLFLLFLFFRNWRFNLREKRFVER